MSIRNAMMGLLATLALTLTAVIAAGCHTVEGAGRDVQAVGGGVADTAEDTRAYDREGRARP
jgi:predicted small secreted protein